MYLCSICVAELKTTIAGSMVFSGYMCVHSENTFWLCLFDEAEMRK